jgi:hypothetical protein
MVIPRNKENKTKHLVLLFPLRSSRLLRSAMQRSDKYSGTSINISNHHITRKTNEHFQGSN